MIVDARSCFIESRSRNVTVSRKSASFSPSVSKSPSCQTACRSHPVADNAVRSRRFRRKTHSCAAAAAPAISRAFATSCSLFFSSGKHRALDRRHARMKSQHDARFHFPLFIRRVVFVIGVADQREHRPIDARARLDHVRDKTLFRFLIEIIERLCRSPSDAASNRNRSDTPRLPVPAGRTGNSYSMS